MSETRTEAVPKRGWLARLRDGLSRSSTKLTTDVVYGLPSLGSCGACR
jgi:hypothetical protein